MKCMLVHYWCTQSAAGAPRARYAPPMTFTRHEGPWGSTGEQFPLGWIGGWLRQTHQDGRRRGSAIVELQARLGGLGVTGCAIVAGPWLARERATGGVWRLGPFPPRAAEHLQHVAEGAGELPEDWLAQVVDDFFADDASREPGPAPCVHTFELHGHHGAVLDPSLSGRRDALLVFRFAPSVAPLIDAALRDRLAWTGFLVVAGLARGERFRSHWEAVASELSQPHLAGWHGPGGAWEQPVNAQEVVQRVVEAANAWASGAARAFDAASVCIFLPDPDDEYVVCLGSSGSARHAYDAGIWPDKPGLPEVGYGLTASLAVAPAYDPAGRPVVVRTLERRDELHARYRDLGFDQDAIAADAPTPAGPFTAEAFLDPAVRDAARQGPWVFTAQRLPPSLSPARRNLVLRFQGRLLAPRWSGDEDRLRTSRDRVSRMSSLALRVHDDLGRLFAEGLGLWRDGLRTELYRELLGAGRWPTICQALASWLSARCVSLWRVEGSRLVLEASSQVGRTPRLEFDLEDGLLDARELRMLAAPLTPRRSAISEDGFLGWPELAELVGEPENTGTWPIVTGGRTVGLLRVDGAMSLYGGVLSRQSAHGGLHHHRPAITPAHVRPVLEETAALLALGLGGSDPSADQDWGDWSRWVQQVLRGVVPVEDALARLDELRDAARNRQDAARIVGVHRNTLRRQLRQLEAILDTHLPW